MLNLYVFLLGNLTFYGNTPIFRPMIPKVAVITSVVLLAPSKLHQYLISHLVLPTEVSNNRFNSFLIVICRLLNPYSTIS